MTFEVGEYRALALIGAGGSARVWSGVQVKTGAPVAIKVFAPDQLPAARREAALAAAVDHPHVVSVIDVLGTAERAVLITELAAGGDLADLLIRRGRLTAGETLTVLVPVAAALATAHERQIVHGDLSAQNIVFDRAGRPLLADLGAARAAAEVGLPVATTPVDAAPELARGGSPTTASDMFSLGSIALACLTGRHAWPAEDLRDVLIQAAAGQWPDPGDDAGPPALIAVIRALLEHDPERRPGAAAVAVDLRAAGRPEPIDLRPAGRLSGATAVGHGAVVIGDETTEVATECVGGTGRHVRPSPTDDGSRESLPSAAAQSDRQQVARARAITRVRSDAAPPADPAPVGRRWRLLRLGLIKPAVGRHDAGSTTPFVRLGVIAVACLVVAVLAGATGLWWAHWDRTDPVALQPGAPGVTAASSARGSVAAPDGGATAVRSAAGAPPTTAVTSGRPPTAARPSPVRSALTTRRAEVVGTAGGGAGGASKAPSDSWLATVSALDDARSRALVARDPALLDAVYTSDSVARSADAAVIAKLLANGLRVSGAEHAVRTARVLGGSPLRVAVNDSLPAYSVLDQSGKVVGRTPSRAVATRVLILVPTAGGYRISQVQSA